MKHKTGKKCTPLPAGMLLGLIEASEKIRGISRKPTPELPIEELLDYFSEVNDDKRISNLRQV